MTGADDGFGRVVTTAPTFVFIVAVAVTVASPLLLTDVDPRPSRSSRVQPEPYPDEWRATLTEARSRVDFDIILPEDPNANAEMLREVFIFPEGHAVALRFPPAPLIAEAPLRQRFIEIFESPYAGDDPADRWVEDLKKSGIIGQRLVDVWGVPALGVTARSPSDDEQANPAFLRFVYDGLDIQISGGDNLAVLIAIARSMVR